MEYLPTVRLALSQTFPSESDCPVILVEVKQSSCISTTLYQHEYVLNAACEIKFG